MTWHVPWQVLVIVLVTDVLIFWLGFECGIRNERAVTREAIQLFKQQILDKRKPKP